VGRKVVSGRYKDHDFAPSMLMLDCPTLRGLGVSFVTITTTSPSRRGVRRSIMSSSFFIILGALYILFAFHEPPEAIAHFFHVPVLAVFFPPERRVKLGRLTFGILLVLMGPIGWLLPAGGLFGGSILGAIVGIALIGLWLAARWRHAGEVSDADDEERIAQWQSFELLKRDPRLHHLQHALYAKGYCTTFERAADPTAYRVAYAVLRDAQWQPLLAHQGAAAAHVAAFLERDVAPKRVHASLDLQTGVCRESEAGLMGWGGLVPLPPRAA
jgi:hypothetical protein